MMLDKEIQNMLGCDTNLLKKSTTADDKLPNKEQEVVTLPTKVSNEGIRLSIPKKGSLNSGD
jgi:hypothetical protein